MLRKCSAEKVTVFEGVGDLAELLDSAAETVRHYDDLGYWGVNITYMAGHPDYDGEYLAILYGH